MILTELVLLTYYHNATIRQPHIHFLCEVSMMFEIEGITPVLCWIYLGKTHKRIENTKGVIKIHKSMKGRQHNCQKKKDKGTKSDLQNTTQKTKDRTMQNPLNIGDELRCSGRIRSSCSTSTTGRVTLVTKLDLRLTS